MSFLFSIFMFLPLSWVLLMEPSSLGNGSLWLAALVGFSSCLFFSICDWRKNDSAQRRLIYLGFVLAMLEFFLQAYVQNFLSMEAVFYLPYAGALLLWLAPSAQKREFKPLQFCALVLVLGLLSTPLLGITAAMVALLAIMMCPLSRAHYGSFVNAYALWRCGQLFFSEARAQAGLGNAAWDFSQQGLVAAVVLLLLICAFFRLRKYLRMIFPLAALLQCVFTWNYAEIVNKQQLDMKPQVFDIRTMGEIPFTLTLFSIEKKMALQAFNDCAEILKKLDGTLSSYKPDSELSRMNARAFEKPFSCSKILWDNLMASKEMYQMSEGNFDVTVGPLLDVWGLGVKGERNDLPSESEIEEARKKVGFDKLIFDEQARTVSFSVKGMKILLGGIAKGYAVDFAAQRLNQLGIHTGMIDLGGNIRTLKQASSKRKSYGVAITNPTHKTTHLCRTEMLNESVATSGGYERFVTYRGKRYAHIISPLTGRPVEVMDSVTIICEKAVMADGLSTALFVGGFELAEKLKTEYPQIEFLCVKANGNTWQTIANGRFEKVKLSPPQQGEK